MPEENRRHDCRVWVSASSFIKIESFHYLIQHRLVALPLVFTFRDALFRSEKRSFQLPFFFPGLLRRQRLAIHGHQSLVWRPQEHGVCLALRFAGGSDRVLNSQIWGQPRSRADCPRPSAEFWPIAEAHKVRIRANRKFILEIRHNEEAGRQGGWERTWKGVEVVLANEKRQFFWTGGFIMGLYASSGAHRGVRYLPRIALMGAARRGACGERARRLQRLWRPRFERHALCLRRFTRFYPRSFFLAPFLPAHLLDAWVVELPLLARWISRLSPARIRQQLLRLSLSWIRLPLAVRCLL